MAEVSHVLARLRRQALADVELVSDVPLFGQLNQLLIDSACHWRDRLLPPLVTFRLFVIQVLHGNIPITALPHLAGFDFAASSYCEARQRLPLETMQLLLQFLHQQAVRSLGLAKQIGYRILIADGSSFSMPDAPELNQQFDLPKGTKPGVGYPTAKLMGLLDAATGLFVSLLALPLFEHDMKSVIGLHPLLQTGDILLGDRALCSYCHVALLNARGVFCCFRLHQRRKGSGSGIERWHKPQVIPVWMHPAVFASLPVFIDVRIVCYRIGRKGYRTRAVRVATTLMDPTQWSEQQIAELYGKRWAIETCFGHLKTTMKMNVLRCKTRDGVMKELAIYLTVYNLIRLEMLKAAARQRVSPDRISFVDALRRLIAQTLGLRPLSKLIVNPDRHGRWQLRVIRRRMKEYDLLKKPRREAEAQYLKKLEEKA
jgi:hypothetical protein